jgi:hypothetical protein
VQEDHSRLEHKACAERRRTKPRTARGPSVHWNTHLNAAWPVSASANGPNTTQRKSVAYGIRSADEACVVGCVRKRREVRRLEHGLRGRAGDQWGDECEC